MTMTVAMCVPVGIFFVWVLICEFLDWRRDGTPSRRLKRARRMPAHHLATERVVMSAESIVYAAWLKVSGP